MPNNETDARDGGATDERTVRRARGLPGGRAVVGAFLVSASAVGIVGAYLHANSEPATAYLIAADTIEPGTRLDTIDGVRAAFGSLPVDLAAPLGDRAIPAEEIDGLVGVTLLSPLTRGDLLLRTHVAVEEQVGPAHALSFSLPRKAAVGGALRPGERIDILATHGASDRAYTDYVLLGAPLLRITAPDGSPVGNAPELLLTVGVTELRDVQALGHAVNTAAVFVSRSTVRAGDRGRAPGSFRAEPRTIGPTPEPALPGPGAMPGGAAGPEEGS